jgi:hypothetical protein
MRARTPNMVDLGHGLQLSIDNSRGPILTRAQVFACRPESLQSKVINKSGRRKDGRQVDRPTNAF